MTKLFALEDASPPNSTQLLIDKVIEQSKQPDKPLSLTADILKQRQELQAEISKELSTPANPPEGEKDSVDTPPSGEEDKDPPTDAPEQENPPQDPPRQEGSPPDQSDDNAEGEDKQTLQSLIGSGLAQKTQDAPLAKVEDTPKQPATESYRPPRPTLTNLFTPLRRRYEQYKVSLESFNLSSKAVALEAQPIVYVQDSVIESLNNLVTLSHTYLQSNEGFIATTSESTKHLNERITVFRQMVEQGKYQFTQTLVKDKDILAAVSIPEKSDPRDTVKVLLNYLNHSAKAVGLVLKNDFATLPDSYHNANFLTEDEDWVYRDVLPGFNLVRVHLEHYKNYLSTPLQNYQYYKLKVLKTEDLYSLNAIAVTEDKELEYILASLDKLLVHLSMTVDNLTLISTRYTSLIDEVKVAVYDVENRKHQDLTQVGIDAKVQEFIRLKLAIEACYIDAHLVIEYMTGMMEVLNTTVELSK